MTYRGGVGESEKAQEGGELTHVQLIHFFVQQKLTQHCKVIMIQFVKREIENLQTQKKSNTSLEHTDRETE